MGNLFQREPSKVFTISAPLLTDFMTRVVQMLIRRDTYMDENVEIYQSIRTFVTKKTMQTEKKKFFERYTQALNELGFTARFARNTPPKHKDIELEERGQKGFVHYDGLQNYIAANTRIAALSFDKLDYLFRIYLALLIAILGLNLLHCYLVTIVLWLHQNWLLLFPFA